MIRGRTTDIWDWEGVLYRDPRYRGGGGAIDRYFIGEGLQVGRSIGIGEGLQVQYTVKVTSCHFTK